MTGLWFRARLERVLRIAVQSIVGKGITPKICYFCSLELRYVP